MTAPTFRGYTHSNLEVQPLCGLHSAVIIFAAMAKECEMSKFVIGPHMRLQEWVAEEKVYFQNEGLDYEFVTSTGLTTLSVKSAAELPKNQIRGAYHGYAIV